MFLKIYVLCILLVDDYTLHIIGFMLRCKGKGKAVPLQAWTGPQGSRKLRFPDFMTTAQDYHVIYLFYMYIISNMTSSISFRLS